MMVEIASAINSVDGNSLSLGLGILACVVSFSVLLHSHRKTQKITQKLLRLERELQVAQGSAIGMGQQLISMEKQLNQKTAINNSESAESLDNKASESKVNHSSVNRQDNKDDSIYDQARQALAQGLSVGDVAKQCGLSYAEVSLLQSLSKSTLSSC